MKGIKCFDSFTGKCYSKNGGYCFTYYAKKEYGCISLQELGSKQCKKNLIDCCKQDFCNNMFLIQNDSVKSFSDPYKVDIESSLSLYNDDIDTSSEPMLMPNLLFIFLSLVIIIMIILIWIFLKNDKRTSKKTSLPLFGETGHSVLVQRTIGREIKLSNLLFKGRFAEIWKAEYGNDFVCVKIYNASEQHLWRREEEIYKYSGHENIARFIAIDKLTSPTPKFLLITNFYENGSLFDFLNYRTFPERIMLSLMYSAVCGLCYLHSEVLGKQVKPGIAHRNLKSKNIMVSKNGRHCLISDFAIAATYRSNSKIIDFAHNVPLGSLRYLAPELLDKNRPSFDELKQADIYSFSLILWEIASRCEIEGISEVNPYKMPYEDEVSPDPSWFEMWKVAKEQGKRPPIYEKWLNSTTLQSLVPIITESWNAVPGARLTVLRLKKALKKMLEELDEEKKL